MSTQEMIDGNDMSAQQQYTDDEEEEDEYGYEEEEEEAVIDYDELQQNPKIVKDRTGFQSLSHLLSFTIVACNGDFEILKNERYSALTWLEEWFFYFEYMWGKGKTITNWVDASVEYKCSEKKLVHIFLMKLDRVLESRKNFLPSTSSTSSREKELMKKWRENEKPNKSVDVTSDRDRSANERVFASDRNANELAIKRCKESGCISQGYTPQRDPILIDFDDVCLAWSFQTNFMSKPDP